MNRESLHAGLLLIALVLAGCAAPEDAALPGADDGAFEEASPDAPADAADDDEATGEPSVPEVGPDADGRENLWTADCEGQVVYVPVSAEDARGVLPDDFTPVSFGRTAGTADDPSTATGYSLIIECARVGGATWEATDVGFGFWGFAVDPPEDLSMGGNGYSWHAFVTTHPEVAERLQADGFPVTTGTVTYERDTVALASRGTSTVSGNAFTLAVETVATAAPAAVDPWTVRFFFVEDARVVAGADIQVHGPSIATAPGTMTGTPPGVSAPLSGGPGGQVAWEGLAQTFEWWTRA